MTALITFCAFGMLWLQQPAKTGETLVGKWVSTTTPAPGEAPMIAPSFSVAVKDNKLTVTMPNVPETAGTVIFQNPGAEPILMVKVAAGIGPSRTFVFHPLAPGQIRVEVFAEYPEARSRSNFYYAEVFKRDQ